MIEFTEKDFGLHRTVGIDFSLNSPAICIHTGTEWSPHNCTFFFMTDKKSRSGRWLDGRLSSQLFEKHSTDTERFLSNAFSLMEFVKPDQFTQIAIEGYAFGAKGNRLFQIGEATGIVKTLLVYDETGMLINRGNNLRAFPPTEVKKFATGKGNADKDAMYRAFVADTGIDLVTTLGMKTVGNPCHDLADSYFIAKLNHSLR